MRQKSGPEKQPAEDAIRDIRRATRRHFSAEEKIRVVLEGARGCPLRQARIGYQRAALALKSMRSRVPEPMKIASFNINIKRRLSNLLNWLREAEPDIPRAHGPRREVPAEAIRRAGNHAAWRGETRWHGVAILARRAPVVTRGLASRRPPMVSAATSRRPLMACLSPRSTLRMETLSQVPNSTKARMAQALDRPRGRTLRDWGTRRAGGRFERCTDRHPHLPD